MMAGIEISYITLCANPALTRHLSRALWAEAIMDAYPCRLTENLFLWAAGRLKRERDRVAQRLERTMADLRRARAGGAKMDDSCGGPPPPSPPSPRETEGRRRARKAGFHALNPPY